MTQAALFDAPPVTIAPSQDDPIIDVIKSFAARVEHFGEDLTESIDEYLDETLYDAMMLRDAHRELATIIGMLSKRNTSLLEKAQEIIDNCQKTGRIKEGNLEIVSKESQGRRSVDKDKLVQERPDVFNLLLNTKIESVKIEYTPTIADLKTILKKRHEDYLKPGEITVTYDLAVILADGEKI